MTEPVAPLPRPSQLTETTTKANAALAGGFGGGAIGAAAATLITYAIWKGAAPPGIEAAIGAILTAIPAAVGAWVATYYAPPNRPLPPRV